MADLKIKEVAGLQTCFLKHLFWRFWVYPKWSGNVLLPKYGTSNRYKNYTYRFWIFFVGKEEHKDLKRLKRLNG